MTKFLIAAFLVAFVFGMAISGGEFRAGEAIGIAILLTAVGAAVARWKDARWGAASMTALAGLILIGH